MKLYNKLFAGVLGMVVGASAITSCTDNIAFGNAFLEKPAGSTVTKDTVFNSAVYTEQFLNAIYALQYYGLPYNNNCGNAASPWTGKFDQITDCWLMHWDNNTIYKSYYSGTLSANENPLLSFTNDKVWEAVRAAWLLLENVDNVPDLSEEKKEQFKAQAKCLMASRYFDLFAVYGGLPLVDHSFTGVEGTYELPRATLDSTVVFMTDKLDEAINSGALRWAYDGNTVETDSTNNIGRWTKAGAMALKAKILTFAASPLFNNDKPYYDGTTEAEKQHLVWYGNYDQARWQKALKACEDFFNEVERSGWYKLMTYKDLGLSKSHDSYRQAYRKGYASQGSHEIIHSVRVGGVDAYKAGTYTWHQWHDSPARQNCLPTQEYVEMFPWSDGRPFNWKEDSIAGNLFGANGKMFYSITTIRGGVKKEASRDPRLYEECIVNSQCQSLDWTSGKSTGDIYELWVDGYDAGKNVATYDASTDETNVVEALTSRYATGYDCNKYYMNQDYLRQYTQWVYLSLDEMYLMYAECLAQTGNLEKAIQMVDVVRDRVGLKSINTSGYHKDANGNKIDLRNDKDKLIEEILRERACELGISNNHYYDLIRYKRGDWFTKRLHGLVIYRMEKNAAGKWVRVARAWRGNDKDNKVAEPSRFDYAKFEITNRKRVLWEKDPNSIEVAKWFLWPFPQTEINKGYGLVQNPGW